MPLSVFTTMKVEIGELTTAMSRDRRRPKRQRTPTTLYTDENPSTFTTKIPKSERDEMEEIRPPKPSFYFVEEDVPDSPNKRSYRRRKPYHKDDMLKMTTAEKLEALSQERQMTETASAAAVPAPPVKRKRGRPPKNRNLSPNATPPVVASATSAAPVSAPFAPSLDPASRISAAAPRSPGKAKAAAEAPRSPRRQNTSKSRSTSTKSSEISWTPPLQDLEGSFLNHAVRLAPILPPVSENGNNGASSLPQSYAQVFGKGLGKVTPLQSPQWAPLYETNVYFDEDYDADTNRLPEDLEPVTRDITCMTTRKPDHAYMAVGDSMGFCTIYSIDTLIRPVARLETVACQQRAREEQEKIRDQQRRKRKSLVVDTSQTTIHALGMIGDRVVLATACELECMDIPSQTSLWVCPLAQDRLVTSLDMHPSRYDVLVSCSLFDNAATFGQTSPLMLLQHSQNNVEVCDANAPILLKSPCCTAIWDNSKNVENRLLFVAVANEELELVLVQGGSIDNWKVACKTRIPVRQSNHFTRLSQSQEGTYTLVASSRGIRLYQTETLQLIHVYGDQLALHGKAVVWNDCLMLGKRSNKFTLSNDASGNMDCDDWLQDGKGGDDSSNNTDMGQYIVGVPHHKGPQELTETLHVWRVEEASVVPAISVPLPSKSEGVQALVTAPSKRDGLDRLILAGRDGDGHVLMPKMKSNFAGIMYPPGYHVITDNVDYMEDEGELDQVLEGLSTKSEIVTENDEEESSDVNVLMEEEMDEDLREAMRQSLLEQKLEKRKMALKDEDVNVINSSIGSDEPALIPCRPEAYLRQAVNSQMDDDEEEVTALETNNEDTADGATASPSKVASKPTRDPKLFVSNILESLGHANPKKHEGCGDFSFSVTAKVVIASAPAQPVAVNRVSAAGRHGKRSRAASLEALLKSSIDPRLQRFMFSKQACATDGRGSHLRPTEPVEVEVMPKHVTPSPDADDSELRKEGVETTTNGLAALSTRRQDEAAVALGLLGLSPNHASGRVQTPDSRVQTPDTDFASDTASRTSSQNACSSNHAMYKTDSESLFEVKKDKTDPNCHACRGRLVIHSCGKRAPPIDFDEVAKVERERKEKEEEEKKRMRAEKRRQADQRRREARKQKQMELEEQRRREEDEIRLEKERMRRKAKPNTIAAAAAYQAAPSAADLDRQRRDLIVASYATHLSHVAPPQAPAAAAMELNSVDYSRHSYGTETAPVAAPPPNQWEHAGVTATAAAPVPRAMVDAVSAYSSGQQSLTLPSASTSMATLSSADALVALASFAGIKADQQQEQPATNGQAAAISAFDRTPAAPSHGFGAGLPIAAPKRAIPSFAAIRGQVNGRETAYPGVAASSLQTNGHAAAAGTYVWPPRADTEEGRASLAGGVKWPPSSS
jgi:hypothetical protein